jgi:lipopolysaccharide transport system ATP-binding protein
MAVVIEVENIGKRYVLQHRHSAHYSTFRELIAGSVQKGLKTITGIGERNSEPGREDFWALRDVSFEVNEGDRLAVIGRNGAGKSTLLKILSRITPPTTGSADIYGRLSSLLEVGTGFHPELSGRENIYLNGAILGMNRAEINSKFDAIVQFAEVERFLDTPVKHYSSGMYVRLAFAVAAHLEPEILLVDEVLAVGDAQFQSKCLGKMESVAREGRTIIFVSHNMAAVRQLCTKGLWIDGGQIRRSGNVREIVEQYLSSGAEASGERHWHTISSAPGNEKIRLRSVRIRNAEGQVTALLDMVHPFTIEIEYDVLASHSGMRTGFWLYTGDGILIFVAGDSVDPSWASRRRTPGRYISRCEVPGMLLNSGSYSVTIAADIQGSEMLFVEQYVLHFSIEHTGFTALDGASRSPGIICPSLKWEISQLNGDRQ